MLIGPPYTPRVAGLGALVADRREHGRRQRSNWKERPNGVEGMVAVAPASGTAKAVASVDSSAGRSQWLSAAGQRLRCGRCLSLAASSSGFVAAVASATGQGGMFLAAVALLASCAMPSSTAPSGTRGFWGRSQRRSSSSVAASTRRGSSRTVVASWYGPGFNGRRTASGEVFNQSELTAASKTLPLGTRVLVTNPANGRSVIVRINDRGPYVGRRQLDLSKRAAQQLGIVHRGTARVRVTVLPARARNSPSDVAASRRGNRRVLETAWSDLR